MSSLAEQLVELLDPRVRSLDPEDDIYEETAPKLVEKEDLEWDDSKISDENQAVVVGRKMQSLEGMGTLYQGKVVSRDDMKLDSDGDVDDEIREEDDQEDDDKNGDAESDDGDSEQPDLADLDDGMDEEIDSDEADEVDSGLKIFKPHSEENSLSKGKAMRNQLSLWESMLEARIKCQKLLTISNRLPQHNVMEMFSCQAGTTLTSADKLLGTLLQKLLDLERNLLAQNSQTRSIANPAANTRKRKNSMTMEELEHDIQDRFGAMKAHRNKVLKLWYDKTRLTSTAGITKSKSFSSFERSTVSQIEDILQDRERLIKRTQLKRSEYSVLGKPESSSIKPEATGEETHSRHLKEIDTEIFDDDDFYHQLLRQLIEQKASGPGGTSDPVELTRQWLRIQRLRTKARKNVDTKASKGRKVRYEIHQKLQSFMAPSDRSTFSHEARNQLFKSLFGNVPHEPSLE